VTLPTWQFDILDHLHANDALHRTITLPDLATTFRSSDQSTSRRMRRMQSAGLVEIDKPDQHSPIVYEVTDLGRRLYHAQLLIMDGVTAPPPLDPHVEIATLAILALHAYGTEAAA
jgi:DNA-binding MarR family transcriptional regulator